MTVDDAASSKRETKVKDNMEKIKIWNEMYTEWKAA